MEDKDLKEVKPTEGINEEEQHEEAKKEKKSKHKEKIESLERDVADLKDKLLRNAAELENFKKRMHEERIKERKYASYTLVSDLVNTLDNLRRAVNMTTDNDVLKNFLIGFKMINDQLFDVLKTDGLKEIDALEKPFDPNLHHAIEKVAVEGKESNLVVEELQKGYLYKERVIRPAMVKVSE